MLKLANLCVFDTQFLTHLKGLKCRTEVSMLLFLIYFPKWRGHLWKFFQSGLWRFIFQYLPGNCDALCIAISFTNGTFQFFQTANGFFEFFYKRFDSFFTPLVLAFSFLVAQKSFHNWRIKWQHFKLTTIKIS